MSDFFGLSYIFDDETMFDGIMAVPPGCIYIVDGDPRADRAAGLTATGTWTSCPTIPGTKPELAAEGLDILEEAVELEVGRRQAAGHPSERRHRFQFHHLAGGGDRSRPHHHPLGRFPRRRPTTSATIARRAAEKAGVRHEEIEVFPDDRDFHGHHDEGDLARG